MMLAHNFMATLVFTFAAATSAHTTFTALFVNGVNQGDGTCVRQPKDPQTSTFPLRDLTSTDMICGRDGLASVSFTCTVPAGATLTFEFRENPDGSKPGTIDPSHKGPCAVYMKQMASMGTILSTPTDGWFKIWEQGYSADTSQWCTEKLIKSNGLLSVALPPDIPDGSYLVRPQLLALHEAQVSDPQFYVGCAQIFVTGSSGSGDLYGTIPEGYEATIPGYVKAGDPSVTFDIYELMFPYQVPGPSVYFPTERSDRGNSAASAALVKAVLSSGDLAVSRKANVAFVPQSCLIKNANWCGVEVSTYSTESGCWDASADCFHQEGVCYESAPPSGHANCDVWDKKCLEIQAACAAGNFDGPPNTGRRLQQVEAVVPGAIPSPDTGFATPPASAGIGSQGAAAQLCLYTSSLHFGGLLAAEDEYRLFPGLVLSRRCRGSTAGQRAHTL
ncbi:endoglucanase b [Grosmannia clavigera kw1407]|uniref:lytic cellulose monooxygenase (C4-dehydrogenating) n=1 Tax=Grosmannia clavigera (strain kw1407 / UAMH 11150) TaxID=655863 RepID=F0XFH5_GROCL|nr:endoglucanase b [Grosmannia clavigera kw1407]EFX04819.1 endoglucanase b [Grosmannia clavigera kw1407]